MKPQLSVSSDSAHEIIVLHQEIVKNLKKSLNMGIRIGGMLTDVKADLKHGEFGGWIQSNMPFTARAARNYMKLFRHRNYLKTERVSDLNSAYLLLKQPAPNLTKQIKKTNNDNWWNVVTAEELRLVIEIYNESLGDPDCWMDPDAKWVFEFIGRGEMDPENNDDIMTARKIEIGKHLCWASNIAWHRGLAELHPAWRGVLIGYGIVPSEEPPRLCGGSCWVLNKDVPAAAEIKLNAK